MKIVMVMMMRYRGMLQNIPNNTIKIIGDFVADV